jgi:hypothetical protein
VWSAVINRHRDYQSTIATAVLRVLGGLVEIVSLSLEHNRAVLVCVRHACVAFERLASGLAFCVIPVQLRIVFTPGTLADVSSPYFSLAHFLLCFLCCLNIDLN